MKILVALVAMLTLASCGADGAPTPPVAKTGVTISGDVQLGVQG